MKVKSFLLVLIFALTPAVRAQEAQAPPAGGSQARTEHRQKVMEMHKQEMEAMKADIGKLKTSLAQMKTNVAAIKDSAEKARRQTDVDMGTVVNHKDRMQKQMESMGPGMMGPGRMRGPGPGGPPPAPPSEPKPQ